MTAYIYECYWRGEWVGDFSAATGLGAWCHAFWYLGVRGVYGLRPWDYKVVREVVPWHYKEGECAR